MYYLAGVTDVASALLATVLFSMALQMWVTVYVHRHRGFRALTLEVLIALSGFKPLVDTHRMLSGHEIAGAQLSLNMERTGCKMVEVVIEAVPSVIIVIRQTLASGVTSVVPLVSILVSLLTIATTSTGIFFGFDMDPGSRMYSPMFYGCIRGKALQQATTRVALYLLSLTHAIAKLFSIAMLLVLSKVALAAYLIGTMALFLTTKILRGDAYYWPPKSGVPISLAARVVTKVFVDVTANPQFRSAPLSNLHSSRTSQQECGSHGHSLQTPLRAWWRRLVRHDSRDTGRVYRDVRLLLPLLRRREQDGRLRGTRWPRGGRGCMDHRAWRILAQRGQGLLAHVLFA